MRKKNSYSRIVQDLHQWQQLQKGVRIQLFHHCVENKITSFYLDLNDIKEFSKHLGTALSESGLSRDKIQLIGRLPNEKSSKDEIVESAEKLLLMLRTDYLNLLLLDFKNPSEETYTALELLKSRGQIEETGSINKRPSTSSMNPVNLWEINLSNFNVKGHGLGELTSAEVREILILKKTKLEDLPELKPLTEKYDLTGEQLAFSWILDHPAYFHLISGGKDETGIDLAVKALKTQLIQEDAEKISEIIRINISND